MNIREVATQAQAQALAQELNATTRRNPVVVVTIASGQQKAYVDVAAIAGEVEGLAEVAVLTTADASWAFSAAMPPNTQVYGGAARVYPVGTSWVANLRAAPLTFVYGPDSGVIQGQLVEQALTMAYRAAPPVATQAANRPAVGTVTGLIGSRALVDVVGGNLLPATARPELTLPGVPAERLFRRGMRVEGRWDPHENRIDVSQSIVPTADNLAALLKARTVLGRVSQVEREFVTLDLLPSAQTRVSQADVPGDPTDLRAIFTEGDIVEALVEGTGIDVSQWQVLLGGLSEAEREAAFAPSLLPGGPAWLEAPLPESSQDEPLAEETPQDGDTSDFSDLLDPGNGSPLVLERDTLAKRLQTLTAELEYTREKLRRAKSSLRRSQDRATEAERQLQSLEDRHGRIGGQVFADPEEQLRFDVYGRWATKTTPEEKQSLPRRDFTVGPGFLETLSDIGDDHYDKVISVIVEIITDRVWTSDARQCHQLRTGSGGDDAAVSRADGAICWRVYLQHKTPQARRLHFWQLPDGVELSSVRLHDDVRP